MLATNVLTTTYVEEKLDFIEKSKENLGHLMVDIESMGNKSFGSVVSIGAVEFDMNTGETGREFYETITLQSCLDIGLNVNGSTVTWWLMQSEAARKEIAEATFSISKALYDFRMFLQKLNPSELCIWGNSARFDLGLLENAYQSIQQREVPWNFRNERDVRTLVAFAPEIKQKYKDIPVETLIPNGVLHHPITDCKLQIMYCVDIWNKLNL